MEKKELTKEQKNKEEELKKVFDNLIADYNKEVDNKKNKSFLLFDFANADENAHTKVLLWLLKYRNNLLLPSFLKLLGFDNPNIDGGKVFGQKSAIGINGKGFIDLYIEVGNSKIIIENKIYGAPDTKKQLARYIATIDEVADCGTKAQKIDKFDNWYQLFKEDNGTIENANDGVGADCSTLEQKNIELVEWCNKFKEKNIYVVYLTADGLKEPDSESLPPALKDAIGNKYVPINYQADILPWLEKDVLPKILNLEQSVLLTGIIQYVYYLRDFLYSDNNYKAIEDYFCKTKAFAKNGGFVNFMNDQKSLCDHIKNRQTDEKSPVKDLSKEMLRYSEKYFFDDINNKNDKEWCIHVLLTCIILYKKSWAALDKRKYTIPTLHLVANNSNYLSDGEISKLDWVLEVDHLKEKSSKVEDKMRYYSNHNKTFRFELSRLKLTSFVSFEDRNNDFEKINSAIDEYKKSNPSGEDNPNLLLDKVYDKLVYGRTGDTKRDRRTSS